MCGRPRQRIREKEEDVAGGMGRTVRPPRTQTAHSHLIVNNLALTLQFRTPHRLATVR